MLYVLLVVSILLYPILAVLLVLSAIQYNMSHSWTQLLTLTLVLLLVFCHIAHTWLSLRYRSRCGSGGSNRGRV